MMGKLLWIAIAYVMGSIPFGLVFARTFCGVDPRTGGSRNVGATNVARLCGTKWGVATLLCDALKGALPVAIAMSFSDSTFFHSLTALAALLGHLYSCFLGFRGGKAVATTVGVFIPLAFGQLVLAGIACLLVIWRSGFVSLGSLTLVTALPVFLLVYGKWKLLPLALVVMALVYWSHRENIGRLARGEEKPWQKKHHDAAPTGCAADTASTDQADLADLASGQAPCGCGCAAHGEPGATPEK
uniref:Glycerol-3-phosphate acyltransferase n=1 Tax=Nitratidesulfovibrio vulgaris (strain DSM 19637 / Miyazaki F) TaxID=883 RepID=B8DQ23_NITV9